MTDTLMTRIRSLSSQKKLFMKIWVLIDWDMLLDIPWKQFQASKFLFLPSFGSQYVTEAHENGNRSEAAESSLSVNALQVCIGWKMLCNAQGQRAHHAPEQNLLHTWSVHSYVCFSGSPNKSAFTCSLTQSSKTGKRRSRNAQLSKVL